MKLKDTLIVTLCDFSKLIDFPSFWYKRRQFIRDLNPQRCYYWTDKQKLLFEVIKTWIDIEEGVIPESEWTFDIKKEGNSLEIVGFKNEGKIQLIIPYDNKYLERLLALTKNKPYRYAGVIALCELIERQIKLEEVEIVFDVASNSKTDIIKVLAGTSLYRKGLASANSDDSYRVRKIEAIGEGNSPVEIYIDNIRQKSLKVGECAYVVCKGEVFIKILLNEKEGECFSLTLCNKPGEYGSSLEVEDNNQNIEIYDNVTSFAFDNAGYPVFTTADGELHIAPGNFTLNQQLKGFKKNYPDTPIIAIEEKNGYYKFYTPQLIYG
jgi:hypothetical protein